MNYRTDLALEEKESLGGRMPNGVEHEEETNGSVTINRIRVVTDEGAAEINKPIGNYITLSLPPFTDSAEITDERCECIADEIMKLLPDSGEVLVAGLGNGNLTADALGPKAAARVLATRHIQGEFARSAGLDGLRSVSVVFPGVLGQTGVETGELIFGVAERISPSAVIVVDALASRRLNRLGCTVQITDSGITPGSGVGNHRMEISEKTMGIPVIAVGVPTVVDAATLAADILGDDGEYDRIKQSIDPKDAGMVVTPKEIDLLIDRAAKLIALSINKALQPQFCTADLLALTD